MVTVRALWTVVFDCSNKNGDAFTETATFHNNCLWKISFNNFLDVIFFSDT